MSGTEATAAPLTDPGLALQQQDQTVGDTSTVQLDQRDKVLPKNWKTADDLAWTTSGDATGFHVLVADSKSGYTWRTAASLSEPTIETDMWIGNACLTSSGRKLVVTYAPRHFTNREHLFNRGAFAATVDIPTGVVKKLPITSTIAYFNPGCGQGESAVLTQAGDQAMGKTRLVKLDATTGTLQKAVEIDGQVTSAVPANSAIVAASGSSVVQIAADGKKKALATSTDVAFRLHADGNGGVVFMDHVGDTARALRTAGGSTKVIAEGKLGEFAVTAGSSGRVFLTGSAKVAGGLPQKVTALNVPAGAEVSSTGAVAITKSSKKSLAKRPDQITAQDLPQQPDDPERVDIAAKVVATGADLAFDVHPQGRVSDKSGQGRTISPAFTGAQSTGEVSATGGPNDPVDGDYSCAVPRNDVNTQVYQPTPRQVEWAVDQAISGDLTVQRPANWKNSGLPAYTPQGMFPRRGLVGGGTVAPQLMLGILSQESNLWQAARVVNEGSYGNPLIGNYYGISFNDDELKWKIDFVHADCGYGIGQVTDGMRRPGHPRPGDDTPPLPEVQQRAIAMDYAANISAALRILEDKWNQMQGVGMKLGNNDPSRIENWFFATWAYNSGYHQPGATDGGMDTNGAYGLGWMNNPVNPNYPADRKMFLLSDPRDAAHPQDWPYPEKVIGFAGNSIAKTHGAGFLPAWWNTDLYKETSKPPNEMFCNGTNDCQPGAKYKPTEPGVEDQDPGPCAHKNKVGQYDLRCWYHAASTWKQDCDDTCGISFVRFDPPYAEQPDGSENPPNCEINNIPSNVLIIDNLPTSQVSMRDCNKSTWSNAGSFRLEFAGDAATDTYTSKADTHQLGAGFGGHFWFAHTRTDGDTGRKMRVNGTWTLDRQLNGYARVMVHMPDLGAHTQRAKYLVNLGNGFTETRSLMQRTEENRWVPLGVFKFGGRPTVSLSNITDPADGVEDIAWDAIAFQPLPGKPRNQVVALGDSYSSGEGAVTELDGKGTEYYRETDSEGTTPYRNACHQSKLAWSRKGVMPDSPETIGARADVWDPNMDYHMLACSGAQTEHLLPSPEQGQPPVKNAWGETAKGSYREGSQLDRGFLTGDTTLVTLSIGGNDTGFTPIITLCAFTSDCKNKKLDNGKTLDENTREMIDTMVVPSQQTVLREIAKKAPNARIILMGYPILLESNCPGGGITDAENVEWLRSIAIHLKTRMVSVVADAQAGGIDAQEGLPIPFFEGKGICGNPEAIHGVIDKQFKTPGESRGPLELTSQQSYHPKPLGTSLYAQAFQQALARPKPPQ
ncbi:hypothetical protein [Lentzea sp. NBRC 105346]|uniref:golvesin C-terminal-like domain-containing protein n=1 Tax=Lentzea sp. NBRC 105346 TaxID=3032205 RepID=UPI00255680A3|nr:hypothetical protein [Lentzea sp. NBRC 105346]